MEISDSVRVEERRFQEPRFKDVDGRIGRVVDLGEREGKREALVRLDPGRVPVTTRTA